MLLARQTKMFSQYRSGKEKRSLYIINTAQINQFFSWNTIAFSKQRITEKKLLKSDFANVPWHFPLPP